MRTFDIDNIIGNGSNDTMTIADSSPIVILFGAPCSGKSLTLIRLARYLINQGYIVQPERTFLPANSILYQRWCEGFVRIVLNYRVMAWVRDWDLMLVTVRDRYGNPICQILDTSGEYYFDNNNPNADFSNYINYILSLPAKRTWVYIVERNWEDSSIRNAYAKKIQFMQDRIPISDKVIFSCHKADLSRENYKNGRPVIKHFFHDIKNQYPDIFTKYINKNPITSLWRPYNFDFVVFSAGSFHDDG